MSERLRHLQRQQSLLREHLAWIETEIAREASATASITDPIAKTPAVPFVTTPVSPLAPASPLPAAMSASPPAPDITADAEAIIERYAGEERLNPADIRRGCLTIFVATLLLLAGGVAAAWLLYYR